MDSHDVRRQWADRTGEYSPAYYAYYGPDERSAALRRTLERYLDDDAAVLEVGCSSGRHLAHLLEGGFSDLTGVELNDDAVEVMAEAYPDLAEAATVHVAPVEDVVGEFEDGQFDAVYAVETLQHLPPESAWVFDELARVTGDLLVTAESEVPVDAEESEVPVDAEESEAPVDGEGSDDPTPGASVTDVTYVDDGVPLYHRDWEQVFTDAGLRQVDAEHVKRNTVRTFRHPDVDGR